MSIRLLFVAGAWCGVVAAQGTTVQFRMMGDRFVPDHFGTALPYGLAFADIDGDGDLDLHVATGPFLGGGQDQLYRNDGRGVFTDVTQANLGFDDRQTAAALFVDVDRDGDLDLVHGNAPYTGQSGQDRLFLNDGTGRFVDVTATHLPVDQDLTTSMAAGDVDGDGDIDLVIGNQMDFGQTVANRLYLNNGAGVFTDATAGRLPSIDRYPRRMVLADIDGDLDLDLIVGNSHGGGDVRIYANNGSGVFSDETVTRVRPQLAEPADIAVFDADGDGDVDLVMVTNGITHDRFYRNNGAGVFTNATSAAFASGRDELVTAGDVDGDGDQDLVVARFLDSGFASEIGLWLNDGTGAFAPATAGSLPTRLGGMGGYGGLALADVDGDHDLDLVAQGRATGTLDPYGSAERLLLNDGSGRFVEASPFELPQAAYEIETCDFDHDGDADLLLAGGIPATLVRNDGKGRFVSMPLAPAPVTGVIAARFEDLDGDGDADLLIACSPLTRLWVGDGTGNFVEVTGTHLPPLSVTVATLALGDVDGDDDVDILLGIANAADRLLLNDGTGHFTVSPSVIGLPTSDAGGVDLADFDGDGDLDLIENLRLHENDGFGHFTLRATLSGLASPTMAVLRVADFSGDGLPDLLITSWTSGQQFLTNLGATAPWTFLASPVVFATFHPMDAEAFDMDGDGDLDVAIVGDTYGALLENRGNGVMALVNDRWYARRGAMTIAVADFDRDGDLDLVEGSANEPCHIYYNQHVHHAVPDPADPGARYRIEFSYHPGYLAQAVLAVPYFSTGEAEIPLLPIGWIGIDPTALIEVGAFVVPPFLGVSSIDLTMPNDVSLRGVTLFGQTLFIDLSLPAAPFHLGNASADTVR